MSARIQSPALLNTQGAYELMEQISAAAGKAIEIDASQVRHLGAQALQILLSAKSSWEAKGNGFEIVNPSPDFRQGVNALGAQQLLASAEVVR